MTFIIQTPVSAKMQTEDVHEISPALFLTANAQISSKEFQRKLYSWFEEKGLVSHLRSYLRLLMINELRNTNVKIEPQTSFSLSRQAFSLIIAEHLLREGYHYTLSVFSTEVPGVGRQFPFSLFEAYTRDESWRFEPDCLFNILELIGIGKNSVECLRIAKLYNSSTKDSLLSCVLNSKVESIVLKNDESGDYLDNLLAALGVAPNAIDSVKRKIEQGFRTKPTGHLEELQTQLCEKNDQLKVMLEELMAHKQGNKKLKQEMQEVKRRFCRKIELKDNQLKEKCKDVAKLQAELEKLRGEKCERQHCLESCQSVVKLNEDLRTFIGSLEDDNRAKSTEIEHLNSRIASLVKDLHNSRLNIDFLNSCLLRSSQINLKQVDDKCASSSEEPSESVTGEILQQVRSRLGDLQRENDALDVRLKQLKLK